MSSLTTLLATRNNILNIINQYDKEQLNHIPEGFNNNLVWNLGHVIVTQQLLCYKPSSAEIRIDPSLIDKYRKGSKPEGVVSDDEILQLKNYAFSTVRQMEDDYNNDLFETYNEYTTSFGVTIDSIESAMAFNNVHEGMHYGYILALRKLVVPVS
ncbi:MAG: hypothetical protein ACI8P3_003305 [Saprospiraceae bacterium]|jgi:hypothetical protein